MGVRKDAFPFDVVALLQV